MPPGMSMFPAVFPALACPSAHSLFTILISTPACFSWLNMTQLAMLNGQGPAVMHPVIIAMLTALRLIQVVTPSFAADLTPYWLSEQIHCINRSRGKPRLLLPGTTLRAACYLPLPSAQVA